MHDFLPLGSGNRAARSSGSAATRDAGVRGRLGSGMQWIVLGERGSQEKSAKILAQLVDSWFPDLSSVFSAQMAGWRPMTIEVALFISCWHQRRKIDINRLSTTLIMMQVTIGK